jgi:hypothetical protein
MEFWRRWTDRLWAGLVVVGLLVLPRAALAGDLRDLLVDLAGPLETLAVSDSFDCAYSGLCEPGALLSAYGGLDLRPLSLFTYSVINDRIVPLSSSVTGYTYEYNEDLDVYERSTSTFGPLFNERAQTLGKGRFLAGLSHSFLEFDEFNGQDLSDLSLEKDLGRLIEVNPGVTAENLSLIGLDVLDLTQGGTIDMLIDMEIKEQVSTLYFTYGLTDRVDIGLVVPLVRVELDARIETKLAEEEGDLPSCDEVPPLPVVACLNPNFEEATDSDSGSETGIGDIVLRGKWQFLAGETNAALLLSGTIPTGDPDNLTGLDDPIFIPGLVASRDFDTPLGGLGLQGYVGYEFRPDEDDEEEVEWAAGFSLQPLGRASINVDFLGSHETSGDDTVLDLAIGTKFMLSQRALLDLNFITPLNDDGLRPTGGIFTAQLEFVFGE